MSLPRPFHASSLIAYALALGARTLAFAAGSLSYCADRSAYYGEARRGSGHGHGCGRNNPGSFRPAGSKLARNLARRQKLQLN
jgi:hypothetical protein